MKLFFDCVFSRVLLLSFLCFLWLGNVEASHEISLDYQSVSAAQILHQEHRTAYHFQPKRHWLNDPNGPMYYNGIYHLFYQYNPKGEVWGNIVWAHSVSKDLMNWEAVEHALYPTSSFDKYGCWTGSTTILPGNKPIILYTGVVDEAMKVEVQNYAIPANLSDPYLRKWIKPKDNPFLAADDFSGINKTAFRDPTTAWMGQDGRWRILIGSRRKQRGIAFLYRSKDFKKWTKAKHPLHSTANTGNWECPDFFPVSMEEEPTTTTETNVSEMGKDAIITTTKTKHVLKVSLDATRYEYYTIGKYYTDKDRYIPDKNMIDGRNGLRLDYGNFYASKSFVDPIKNRRVVWAWVNESDTKVDDVRKGWAGIMAIPRTVWLHPNGKQLLLWPIKELETLRGKTVSLSSKKLRKGDQIHIKGITAAQADVEVTFSFPSLDKAEAFEPRWSHMDAQELCAEKGSTVQGGLGPFGLLILASKNLEEYTPVFFRVFKAGNHDHHHHVVLMCSDASSSSLKKGLYKPSFAGFLNLDLNKKKISLRSLIDHSVVESFGEGGKVCITSRVYPTLAIFDKALLYAFNNGTETITVENLHAWSMHRPQLMN